MKWELALLCLCLPTFWGNGFCAVKQDETAPQLLFPFAKEKENDLFDVTDCYRAMWGIPGRFTIDSAEIDSRAAAADGCTFYHLKAHFLQPGTYLFNFEKTDNLGYAFEKRMVRLRIADIDNTEKNSSVPPQEVPVSPEDSFYRRSLFGYVSARLCDKIYVNWSYYPGGEGIPGGWGLTGVKEVDSQGNPVKSGNEIVLGYEIEQRQILPQTTAVIRENVAKEEEVYKSLGKRQSVVDSFPKDGAVKFGPTCLYFPGGRDSSPRSHDIAVEMGIVVGDEFKDSANIHCSGLPGGEVVLTTQAGSGQPVPNAGKAIKAWCKRHERVLAGPHWEVYGFKSGDNKTLVTYVIYLLKPAN